MKVPENAKITAFHATPEVRVGETPLDAELREYATRVQNNERRLARVRAVCITFRDRGEKVDPETILHLINE